MEASRHQEKHRVSNRCKTVMKVMLTLFLLVLNAWVNYPSAIASTHGKAISLNALQQTLRTCQSNQSCPDGRRTLFGMTRLHGYVIDRQHHDVILIGVMADRTLALHLDDFIVAFRNAWLKYADFQGNTYYYSSPGCSIDPNPKVIQKLQELASQIRPDGSSKNRNQAIASWQNICHLPQTVRVLGIPFHSHFGRVLVDADYDMKLIVDGSVQLNIQEFQSLSDMTLARSQTLIEKGTGAPLARSAMNRFWFYPGENRYLEASDIATVEASPVTLLTEAEFLSERGKITGRGTADSLAAQFAHTFTQMYTEIASRRPIYLELENLFRMVAVAKMLRFKKAFAEAGLAVDYLLNDYSIIPNHTPRQLPGRSNFKHFTINKGNQTIYFWLPTCGGVDIAIEPDAKKFSRRQADALSQLKSLVLSARPTPQALHWTYPAPGPQVAAKASPMAVSKRRRERENQQESSPKHLQQMLQSLGYYEGALDGILGPQSRKALQQFQAEHGLPFSGKIAPASYRQLSRAYHLQERLQQVNRTLAPGERPTFAVQRVSRPKSTLYLVYVGRGRPQLFRCAEQLNGLLDHTGSQRGKFISTTRAFNLELTDFPPDEIHSFAFNVQIRQAARFPGQDIGLYVRTGDGASSVKIDWMQRQTPRIQRQGGWYAIGFKLRDVTLTVFAKTRETLVHLLIELGRLFSIHPDYMSLSAEDMARLMRKDIEAIRQNLRQRHGTDGDSQINFRDQVSDITITRIERLDKDAYVAWVTY